MPRLAYKLVLTASVVGPAPAKILRDDGSFKRAEPITKPIPLRIAGEILLSWRDWLVRIAALAKTNDKDEADGTGSHGFYFTEVEAAFASNSSTPAQTLNQVVNYSSTFHHELPLCNARIR